MRCTSTTSTATKPIVSIAPTTATKSHQNDGARAQPFADATSVSIEGCDSPVCICRLRRAITNVLIATDNESDSTIPTLLSLPDDLLSRCILAHPLLANDLASIYQIMRTCRRLCVLASDSLTTLRLGSPYAARLNGTALVTLLRRFSHCTDLDASYCTAAVTPTSLTAILEMYGSQLRTLDLTGCSAVTDECVGLIATRCLHLESLSLAMCPLLTNRAIDALYSTNVPQFPISFAEEPVVLPRLASLNLSACLGLNDASLGRLVAARPPFARLGLKGCFGLSDTCIGTVAARCGPTLRRLCLAGLGAGLTDASLVALGHNCPSLSILSLAHCTRITDAGMAALAAGCTQLECLNLWNCTQLTDLTLFSLASVFSTGGRLPQGPEGTYSSLRKLRCDNCYRLTDAGVVSLASACPALESCSFYGCQQLSDTSLTALATHCPRLRSVCLAGASLTDGALVRLVRGCPGLQVLNLDRCVRLTAAAVWGLLYTAQRKQSQCQLLELPELTLLSLASCPAVTSDDAAAMNARFPQVHIVAT